MSLKFNLDEIKDNVFLNKEGEFTFTVKSHKRDTTSTGNLYDQYTCETDDGETLNVFFVLTEKALWKYKSFIKALGHPAKGEVDFENLPSKIIGKTFIGTVVKNEIINVISGTTDVRFEITNFYKDDQPF